MSSLQKRRLCQNHCLTWEKDSGLLDVWAVAAPCYVLLLLADSAETSRDTRIMMTFTSLYFVPMLTPLASASGVAVIINLFPFIFEHGIKFSMLRRRAVDHWEGGVAFLK